MTAAQCCVHVHTNLCDGQNTPAEMAAAAYAAGIQTLGFSGHSHTPIPDDDCGMLPDMTEYRHTVLSLREQYAGRMDILLGLELDSQADVSASGFDYWIGSVHWLYHRETNTYHAVDWDAEKFASGIQAFGGIRTLSAAYYREAAAVAKQCPTILGHFDLLTKFNEDGSFFDETAPWYQNQALDALSQANPDISLLEINTGAMSRGYRSTPYPARFLLEGWREMGGQVIVTSDTHSAETILYGYRAALDAARQAGYRETAVLTKEGIVLCPCGAEYSNAQH